MGQGRIAAPASGMMLTNSKSSILQIAAIEGGVPTVCFFFFFFRFSSVFLL